MSMIVVIRGRDAIPIRAISFLTDWTVLAPLDLAESLSGKHGGGRIGGLTSYRLDGETVKPIKQSWWIDASVAIASIDEVSKLNNVRYSEWQLACIQELPTGAFVWLDDFEDRFSRSFLDDDNDCAADELADLRPAILGLDYSPFIEAEMLTVVMKGFSNPAPPVADTEPSEPQAVGEWVAMARTRAVEIVKEQRERDLYPSQESIGDTIAAEFRKAGIVGTDGKPLTGATIKRHALKGISSAVGKRLSTSIRQGK